MFKNIVKNVALAVYVRRNGGIMYRIYVLFDQNFFRKNVLFISGFCVTQDVR